MLLQAEQELVDGGVVNLEIISILCSETENDLKEENKHVQRF